MKQITCTITGRVQMVMYRDFAQRKARKLGIVGMVQNMPDGSVSVVAQGEEEALKKYLAYLKKGSLLAHVDTVAVAWREPSKIFSHFVIVYG